jgi:hypothetical protein
MKPAEFEEREYEAPLYNQLERGSSLVWSPGQVFEGHIGIDHGIFLEDDLIFGLHGYASHLPGARLSRYRWPLIWRRDRPDRLPSFNLNLFIQAKRSSWGRNPTKALKAKKFSGAYWRFQTDAHQQGILEAVAEKLKTRALVVYAAPVFHQHKELHAHTRKGTIVENSTFPSVASLKGHKAWNYQIPGAKGIANADPEEIDEPPLARRIATLIEESRAGNGWGEELGALASDLRAVVESDDDLLAESSRRGLFADQVLEIERATERFQDREALAAFFTIVAFCEIYLVMWQVLGR